ADLNGSTGILIRANRDTPGSQEVHALLVECLVDRLTLHMFMNEFKLAVSDCDELIKLEPLSIKMDELHATRAYCQLMGGDIDKAIITLRETLAKFETDLVRNRLYDYLFQRSKRHYAMKLWDHLIPDIKEMIPIAPDGKTKIDLYRGLGELLTLTGDLVGACDVLRKASKEFPGSAELKKDLFATLDAYRLLCWKRQDWRSVVELSDEQLGLCDPQDRHALGVLYLGRANARRVCGEYDGAIGDSTKSLEYETGNGDALTCRGLAELGVGLLVQAIDDLTAAINNVETTEKELALRGRAEAYQHRDLHE